MRLGAIRGRARRPVLVLAIALAVGVSAAAFWSVREARQRRAAGVAAGARRAVAARDPARARPLLDRWSALRPGDAEPYYLRAKLEVAADRPAEAFDALRLAGERGFDRTPLGVLAAVLQARAGRVDEARQPLLNAYANANGPEPEVDEALARVLMASFRLSEASKVIDRWQRDAPDDPQPYLYRNEIDARVNPDPAVMIRNYRLALDREPSLLGARLGLAAKLRESNRIAEAAAEYKACLDRHPGDRDAEVGAGQTAFQSGDINAAERHFRAALAADPAEPNALAGLALIDLRNGRYAQARDRLKAALAADPYSPEAHYNYARALKLTGDDARSRAESALSERLRKEHERMNTVRGDLLTKPDDVPLRLEAARWMVDHGRASEGVEWAELILRDHPDHPAACRLLAEYHRKLGNVGLANYYLLAASRGDGPGR